MESSIRVNGLIIKEKGSGDKFGQMDRSIKECGAKIWPMAKADLYIQEAMFMKEIGLMIRLQVEGSTYIKMEHPTQVNGWMTSNMDTV